MCGKTFEKNEKVNSTMAAAVGRDSNDICYACALERITGGHAPEEGDFNSAHLISGEISDKDLGYLMEDLRNVELGRSTFEPYEEDSDEDWEDPAWCYTCNKDTAFCTCYNCSKCGLNPDFCECEDTDEK
ncbi:MAG: hypothetical protein HYT69_02600 [Candidatus Zambryskibacteria bacterium]|nr:hypothetical protein [Candidatus Zambryskibacteria bacterium]